MVSILRKNKTTKTVDVKFLQRNRGDSKNNQVFSKAVRASKNYSKQILKSLLKSRYFQMSFNILAIATVISLVIYFAYTYINNSVGNDVVVSKSEIVSRVSKLTQVPSLNPSAVVRVEDPETLKKQNVFYENVKVGDYIIMYPSVAIIYDLMNNVIVSVKKVEGQQ